MDIKIRTANENDYIHILELVKEVHALHVKNRPDIYLQTDSPLLKDTFKNLLTKSNIKIFVVEDTYNNKIIAYSIVQIILQRNISLLLKSKFAYIDHFCVKSTHQKLGIGKALFNHIVIFVKSQGVSSLQLTVCEFNKNAINFYESLGMSTRNRKMELNL
ncbi:GNAT family N-acetyltransferase [Clostridium felsineum]|uniref:Uncharacterized protein n=1 Tax=Clostridium felsineum TaxID=36839 RepID=A0A1S8MER9_9CLOT|nr:GNAT family N-acetyltransferase [Clostridium felsineum]MCR3761029.1 GNAT family N-acetyltransferase [Clostridium felsineum]URZ07443.1 hypothetical protein CLROS_027810 [Clostridium felsineum]URZ12474.1 hypothetical protein CROST_031960 [Clostridium felsineum]